MCLSRIIRTIFAVPSTPIIAYKVVRDLSTIEECATLMSRWDGLYYRFPMPDENGVYEADGSAIAAHSWEVYPNQPAKLYQSGFHCYETETSAKLKAMDFDMPWYTSGRIRVVKVALWGNIVEGEERRGRVYVGQFMKVLGAIEDGKDIRRLQPASSDAGNS